MMSWKQYLRHALSIIGLSEGGARNLEYHSFWLRIMYKGEELEP